MQIPLYKRDHTNLLPNKIEYSDIPTHQSVCKLLETFSSTDVYILFIYTQSLLPYISIEWLFPFIPIWNNLKITCHNYSSNSAVVKRCWTPHPLNLCLIDITKKQVWKNRRNSNTIYSIVPTLEYIPRK